MCLYAVDSVKAMTTIVDEVEQADFIQRSLNLYDIIVAQEVEKSLCYVNMKNCEACRVKHRRHIQHTCTRSQEEILNIYFEETLNAVMDWDVIENWNICIRCIGIPWNFVDSFALLLQDDEWRINNIPKTREWKQKIYRIVLRLIQMRCVISEEV